MTLVERKVVKSTLFLINKSTIFLTGQAIKVGWSLTSKFILLRGDYHVLKKRGRFVAPCPKFPP